MYTNCPAIPPHRLMGLDIPYNRDWMFSHPAEARFIHWSSDRDSLYEKVVEVAEMDLLSASQDMDHERLDRRYIDGEAFGEAYMASVRSLSEP